VRSRVLLRSAVTALGLLCLATGGITAQELPLRRALPPAPADPCAVPTAQLSGVPQTPSDQAGEADRRVAEANQAAILGDPQRALTLLAEAVALDPASPLLRYRLGRAMEEVGEEAGAVAEYCRYLALAPDGAEAAEVRARLDGTSPFTRRAAALEAHAAFDDGIAAYDRGEFDTSALHFSRALVLEADWAAAHYNRGVAYVRAGRIGAGTADLGWYLELSPNAEDRTTVEARLAMLQLARAYSPATALLSGILIPGMGHFYSGRPGTGALVLAVAGGSAAAGLLVREVEISCLSVPVNGECPSGQVAGREESRPFLVPGLAVAAAVTVAGAIHAFRGAQRSGPAGFSFTPSGDLILAMGSVAGGSRLRVGVVGRGTGSGIRTGIELPF